jgi:5-methylcytosine-specific restriction protein A
MSPKEQPLPQKPPTHKPARADIPRASKESRGYGRHWQVIRLDYLQRHPLCTGEGCREAATTVDHRVPQSQGGGHDEDNLRSYCASCHARKSVLHDGGLGRERKTLR